MIRRDPKMPVAFYSDGIPPMLKRFDRWSPWKAVWSEKRGKFDKIPQLASNPDYGLSTAKPDKWVSFDKALAALDLSKSAGLGFVMTGVVGVVAIDLDNCLNAPWALAVIGQVGSYTEISPSGKGYRIFLMGSIEADWTNHEVGIEVYGGNEARFLTVTGTRLPGSPENLTLVEPAVLADLAKQYAKERRKAEIIDLSIPEIVDDMFLPSTDKLPIPGASLRFLQTGEFDTDRSGTLFGVGVSLFAAGYTDAEVFSILATNDYALDVAMDHRRQDNDRALLYLWREHCLKAKGKGQSSIVTADEFDVVELEPGEADRPNYLRDGKGKIEATIENITKAVRCPDECGVEIRHDQFRDEIMFNVHGQKDAWQTFKDADYSRLRIALEKKGFKPVGRELIRDVVLLVAEEQQFDSAILWLGGLAWDGVLRVENFLCQYFGAEDSPYIKAVSLYLWTAMAGRVLVPGIKADMVPILIGEQGALKSSSVAAMVPSPDFFTEVSFHEKDDDLARKMRGRLLAEIGELRGLHTRELESIKAFITRTHENWVPKYREFATSFPRRLVFIGTTNQSEFLADETGNRRFLPVKTQRADIDAVKADRLQLWAEGRELFELLGVAYQGAESLAKEAQAEHVMHEPWADDIAKWLDEPDMLTGEIPRAREFLLAADIARECLRIDAKNYKRADQMQIGKVLRAQGFKPGKPYVNGAQIRAWVIDKTT